MSSVASKQITVQPQRHPQSTSALPRPLLQREPLGVPENCVFGWVYDQRLRFHNEPFCRGCREQHCLARQDIMHANKNNELMSQDRIALNIHPVYKWQDASHTPSPGGRAGPWPWPGAARHRSYPGRTGPIEISLRGRQGDVPPLPGFCLRDSPRLPPALALRMPCVSRSRTAFSIDTLDGNLPR